MESGGATRDFEIVYSASSSVREGLARAQRAEDVRFSPNGRRLALIVYQPAVIALADVEVSMDRGRPQVVVTNMTELSSPLLRGPHGLEFLDDDTIVVANRYGDVTTFRLPSEAPGGTAALTAIDLPPGQRFELLSEPSALAISRGSDGDVEILVCNNGDSTVTRHVLRQGPVEGHAVTRNELYSRQWLAIPDGIAISPDDAWIAVSNHDNHRVMMYARSSTPAERTDPDGILRGAWCPHGIRFSPDGSSLFVADADSPYVHVFLRDGDAWDGVRGPAESVRVVSDDAFEHGYSFGAGRQGGPKGLDIDRDGLVLAVTYEHRPLAFFDATAIVDHARKRVDDPVRRVTLELTLAEQEHRVAARLEQRIVRLKDSASFRVTKPLRQLNAAWSSLRHRGGPRDT